MNCGSLGPERCEPPCQRAPRGSTDRTVSKHSSQPTPRNHPLPDSKVSPVAHSANNPAPLPPHAWDAIDRYAEGAMDADELAALEARMSEEPAFARAVEAHLAARERFRAALQRVMATEAPVGLHERVRDALRAEMDETPISIGPAQRRWFDGPARANAMAVAASLMLVGGAVLFGIFGPRISDRPPIGSPDTPVTEVAERIGAVHQRCSAQRSCGGQDEPWRSAEEAQTYLTRRLRRPFLLPDLEAAGFSFCCGGPYCVPGACEEGAQLLYCRPDPDTGSCSWLSIFVAPVETPYLAFDPFGRTGPLQCGIDYSMPPGCGEAMHYWCDGTVTWFVKADDDIDFAQLRTLFPAG